ncbi:MAG TPA: bifunctional DNA-binding transcriptional regulator/O6-methylguanine-DNA methyltransferase Ada [Gemmatimonadaceae bacterium]|nr:bifunctional DNA-binding transcriptional regulator/O6-methylguanine-DNA methyltransferase Ada [Gemmatimonadaceae bacterium]
MPTTFRAEPATPALDGDEAWRAVERRDPRFDGRFVYAVGSTRIYCRPSCPSRRPARGRVTFYSAPAAAEEAGYRACRRCHPREAQLAPTAVAIERARLFIEEHPDQLITLASLAAHVGLSQFHLQRTFKRLLGVSPREYHDTLRVSRFKSRLRAGDTVSRATYEAGFGSSSRVYERSDKTLGMTPASYRRGGAGMHIRYTIVDSPFGKLLVGATDRGVCAVALGDNDDALVRKVQADFPRAEMERGDDAHRDWIAEIVNSIGAGNFAFGVPLDMQGTVFQQQVWALLRKIPAGRTRSYSEIAAALGNPRATRAVAQACASNRIAVVIPCHRVVRNDGALGGYKWGVERKKTLLERERRRTR